MSNYYKPSTALHSKFVYYRAQKQPCCDENFDGSVVTNYASSVVTNYAAASRKFYVVKTACDQIVFFAFHTF